MDGVDITATHELRFADGRPVRAASAVTPLSGGWLIAQDDATHAAFWRAGPAERLRLLPPVEGEDQFSEAAGTKDLKPDLEAAFTVGDAALLLGSGSLPARMRAVLVTDRGGDRTVAVADLGPLYRRVADALGAPLDAVNLEGACPVGEHARWFQRGHGRGVPSASVGVDLAGLLAAVRGQQDPATVEVTAAESYDLGEVDGVGLAITDAVALPDGRIVVSAVAEDAPDAVADGPIVGSAVVLLDGRRVLEVTPLPRSPDGEVRKVEGLALLAADGDAAELLAVVDQDDPQQPSSALTMTMRLR